MEILKYLHNNGCPRGTRAVSSSISWEGIETLQWLINNGHRYGEDAFTKAAQRGSIKALQHLKSINCTVDGFAAIREACRHRQLNAADWLLHNVCVVDQLLNTHLIWQAGISSHNVKVLEWLDEKKFLLYM